MMYRAQSEVILRSEAPFILRSAFATKDLNPTDCRPKPRAGVHFLAILLACLLTPSLTFAAAPVLKEVREPSRILSVAHDATLTVVNIWATWCEPCVEEMPILRSIRAAFGERDVAMLGVSMDDLIPGDRVETKTRVARFLAARGITWPIVYYVGKNDPLAGFFHFDGSLPITVVYDRQGKEVWRREGMLDEKSAVAGIRKLLARAKQNRRVP